jgi:hypothetical protein
MSAWYKLLSSLLVHIKIKSSINTVQESIGTITGRDKIDISNKHIYDRSLSWLGINKKWWG